MQMSIHCRRSAEPWSPLGAALMEFHRGRHDATIVVESDIFATETFNAAAFYRPAEIELPELETEAIRRCRGRVLDVGAGAGRHALELQQHNHEVVALDVAPQAVEVMSERGVRDARHGDVFTLDDDHFDTILLLMNGIGVAGTCDGLARLLKRLTRLLAPGGQILCDSADLQTEIDRSTLRDFKNAAIGNPEIGEIFFRLQFDDLVGDWYPWLFASASTLAHYAGREDLMCSTLTRGERGSFLTRFSKAR